MIGFIDWLDKNRKITEIEEYNRKGGVQRVDFRLTYDGALGALMTVFVAGSPASAGLAVSEANKMVQQGCVQVPYVGQHKFAMQATERDHFVLAVLPQGAGRSKAKGLLNDYKASKFLIHLWWCLRWNYENPSEARKLPHLQGETGAAHVKAGCVGASFGSEIEQLIADIYSSDSNLMLFKRLCLDSSEGSKASPDAGLCYSEFEQMLTTMMPSQDWEEITRIRAEVLPANDGEKNYKADVLIRITLRDATTITTTVSIKCPCNNRGANIANGGPASSSNQLLSDLGLNYDRDRELIDCWSDPKGANWDEARLQETYPNISAKLQAVKIAHARAFLLNQLFGKEDATAPTQAQALLSDHLDAGHGFFCSKTYVERKLRHMPASKVATLFVFFASAKQQIRTPTGTRKGSSCLRVRLLTSQFKAAITGRD